MMHTYQHRDMNYHTKTVWTHTVFTIQYLVKLYIHIFNFFYKCPHLVHFRSKNLNLPKTAVEIYNLIIM